MNKRLSDLTLLDQFESKESSKLNSIRKRVPFTFSSNFHQTFLKKTFWPTKTINTRLLVVNCDIIDQIVFHSLSMYYLWTFGFWLQFWWSNPNLDLILDQFHFSNQNCILTLFTHNIANEQKTVRSNPLLYQFESKESSKLNSIRKRVPFTLSSNFHQTFLKKDFLTNKDSKH
jgi:hypothetical protein